MSPPSTVADPRVEVFQQAGAGIRPIAEQDHLPIGKPAENLSEHFGRQVYRAGLAFARMMQTCQQGQTKDLLGKPRDGDDQAIPV